MKKAHLVYLAFCVFGFGAMLYSAWQWFALHSGELAAGSFCNINDYWNCDRVSTSAYGAIAGFPIGLFGSLYFLILIFLSFYGRLSSKQLFLIILPSWFVCLGLLAVLIFDLKTGCLICMMGYVGFFGAGISARYFQPQPILGTGGLSVAIVVSLLMLSVFAATQKNNLQEAPAEEEVAAFKQWFDQQTVQEIPDVSPFKKGAINPTITITEFSDFRCPHCATAAFGLIPRFLQQPDVQVIFMPLPFDGACHPDIPELRQTGSCEWVKFSICANEQGQFWEAHDLGFQNTLQGQALPLVEEGIQKLDLNAEQMKTCLENEETDRRLADFIEVARDLQIRGTPTFFINGKKIQGISDYRAFDILFNHIRSQR